MENQEEATSHGNKISCGCTAPFLNGGWSICEKFKVIDQVTGEILFQQSIAKTHLNITSGKQLGFSGAAFNIKDLKAASKSKASKTEKKGERSKINSKGKVNFLNLKSRIFSSFLNTT